MIVVRLASAVPFSWPLREGEMAAHELTALEALGVGIRAAIDASEVYSELARRVSHPFLQQKTLLLAKEEAQHQRILEEAYYRQFPDIPLALPPSQLPKQISCKTDRERLSVTDVLSCAIDLERKARKFYLQAARRATDLSGQRMFNYLADWEFSHEMELSAERDMLRRYPRYFEQTAEAWKPEFRQKPPGPSGQEG